MTALVAYDRVKESSTSTGAGNITLAGAATGFRTFNAAVGVGPYFTYAIVHQTANEWEVRIGYLSAATTLVRSTLISSSTGSTVSFTAGTKDVFITFPSSFAQNNTVLSQNVYNYDTSGTNNVIIGYQVDYPSTAKWTVGIGANSTYSTRTTVRGDYAVAVGAGADADYGGVSIGHYAIGSSGGYPVAIGNASTALNGIAIGNSSYTQNGIAMGNGTLAYNFGTVIGNASSAVNYQNHVIVGYQISTNASTGSTIALGSNLTLSNPGFYVSNVRTSISAVGTQYPLVWDNSTKEITGTSGGGGGYTPRAYCTFDANSGALTAGIASLNVLFVSNPVAGVWTVNFVTATATVGPGICTGTDSAPTNATWATGGYVNTTSITVFTYDWMHNRVNGAGPWPVSVLVP